MTSLDERITAFEILFENLQSTNSRLEKEQTVNIFTRAYPELVDDWTFILETLDGKHPIGWTFTPRFRSVDTVREQMPYVKASTIKDLIKICLSAKDKTFATTYDIEKTIGIYGEFLAPIVNRTLRLGIGKSLLSKSDISPMLAKKYEGGLLTSEYVVTEKLDGNRCIAAYNKTSQHWEFYSRSGKFLKVDFDMAGFDTDYIYDGEVMSDVQTKLSMSRYQHIITNTDFEHDTKDAQLLFNQTSGLINRGGANKKGLVYNIFDIVSSAPYYERRNALAEACDFIYPDVNILPALYVGNDRKIVNDLLGKITQMGGEGIMLNNVHRGYEHKRSDALLKYKQVQFMDMRVENVYLGTGKYEGQIGGLSCEIMTEDGRHIECDVGTGLSDMQRLQWAIDPQKIIGKIVQIGYHELTQAEYNIGTNHYSLRFPRLIKVRNDKNDTSEF